MNLKRRGVPRPGWKHHGISCVPKLRKST